MSDVVADLNAGFVALVQHATTLYDIRQAELALLSEQFEVAKTEDHLDLIDLLVDLNNVEACNVTLELVTLIYELNNDDSFLNLLEFNAPGCHSAMDAYDFAYECVSHLRNKKLH